MLDYNVELSGKTVLVTGAAGFIGAGLVKKLLETIKAVKIVGIDNLNDYYDVSIKEKRLDELNAYQDFRFIRGNIADRELVRSVFAEYRPSVVVNLAAQAGVRYSITNPDAYMESNITGFYNILEACRHSYDDGEAGVEHLVYASSSSVYGGNKKVPYSTEDMVDHPVSLYAATKKTNELLAHSYSKFRPRACAFSPFTGREAGRIWHISALRKSCGKAVPFRYSITVTAKGILHT